MSGTTKDKSSTKANVSDIRILLDLIKVAPTYPGDLSYAFGSLAGACQYRKLYDLFRKEVPKNSKVLDWGAGNGHFSYWLFRNGYQAAGFGFEPRSYFGWFSEPSYEYKIGTPNSPVTIPYPNNYFDAVTSVGVLEHVRDTGGSEVSSLREIKRLLKTGGVFICYHLPNKYSWIDFVASKLPKRHHHDHRYTKNEIKNLISEAGLTFVEGKRYGFLPRNSLRKVGGRLKTSVALMNTWNTLDDILSFIFNPLCQNHWFLAKNYENSN